MQMKRRMAFFMDVVSRCGSGSMCVALELRHVNNTPQHFLEELERLVV